MPVFVDVRPDTYNIDPTLIEAAITARTKAVLVVHQLGMPCELDAILDITTRHGLPVVEDAACAIGSEIRWQGQWERLGRPHGDVACFSFHPRKLLSTGDGGMLTTRNADLDARFRLLRQHGMSVPDTVRHASTRVVFEEYTVAGFNYRMTDIQAAIGRVQLSRLAEIVSRRRDLAARYGQALQHVAGITPAAEPEWARSNWQSYTVGLEPPLDQRRVMQRMLDDGIATRRGVMNAHREPAYPPGSWRGSGPLTTGERLQETTIVLPLYHQMTPDEQDRVVASLKRAVAH
jgi:perosamine synthetase